MDATRCGSMHPPSYVHFGLSSASRARWRRSDVEQSLRRSARLSCHSNAQVGNMQTAKWLLVGNGRINNVAEDEPAVVPSGETPLVAEDTDSPTVILANETSIQASSTIRRIQNPLLSTRIVGELSGDFQMLSVFSLSSSSLTCSALSASSCSAQLLHTRRKSVFCRARPSCP